jgi:hypothetical protein
MSDPPVGAAISYYPYAPRDARKKKKAAEYRKKAGAEAEKPAKKKRGGHGSWRRQLEERNATRAVPHRGSRERRGSILCGVSSFRTRRRTESEKIAARPS